MAEDQARVKCGFLSNFRYGDGWTEQMIEQAASETGFSVMVGKSGLGVSNDTHFGVWTEERARDHQPFWDRACELKATGATNPSPAMADRELDN